MIQCQKYNPDWHMVRIKDIMEAWAWCDDHPSKGRYYINSVLHNMMFEREEDAVLCILRWK